MSNLLRSLQGLFESAGYVVAIPLVVLGLALWILLIERAVALGSPIWELVLPSARRRRAAADLSFRDALSSYLEDPRSVQEAKLLECSSAADGPEPLLVRRFLSGTTGGAELESRDSRKLRLRSSLVQGQSEVRDRSGLVRMLSHSTLLWGVFAAVTGVERTLYALSVNGVYQESLWLECAPGATLGCELAVVAFLPAFVGQIWISTVSSRRARELDMRYASLAQILEQSPETARW